MAKIALLGKMGSGKTEAEAYLVEKYGFKSYAFAQPLKAICKELFPDICAFGKPRWLYQKVGQFMRQIDPDVWVRLTIDRIEQENAQKILVTDLRQGNEYAALMRRGFKIIKIEADDDIRRERCFARGDQFTEINFHHDTEIAVDYIPYDYVVTNNSSLDEFHKQLDEMLVRVGVGYGFQVQD